MKGEEQENVCRTTEWGLIHPAKGEGKLLGRGIAVPIPKGEMRPKNALMGKVQEVEGTPGKKE